MKKYKSIFVSDFHLGSPGCKAEKISLFLKENTCENLFLIGDIIDGWRLKRKWFFPQEHMNVLRRILTSAKRDTNVFFIPGNHDEFVRKFLVYDLNFGNIQMIDEYEYHAVNGKKYLVIHGDQFDSLMFESKWLMHLGDNVYNFMIFFNTQMNKIRKLFGMKYWSLSKWLKQNAKEAVNYIYKFEDKTVEYCKEKQYDGIFCGHIHTAEIKTLDDIEYYNTGDWVESCTAIVEHYDGTFELLDFSNV